MRGIDQIEVDLSADLLCGFYDKIQRLIDECPECIPELLISDFAEKYRRLSNDTPYPGRWSNARTPYLIKPMNCLAPSSKTIETVFAKPSQFGATAGIAENWIGYIIKVVPGPSMYISSTEKLIKKWIKKRLNPMLIASGLQDRIAYQHNLKNARKRTGSETFALDFPGGSLDMVTANSAPSLRMDSIRNMIMDEVSAYKWALSGEGDPVTIAEARTKAWKQRRKILYISSPVDDMTDHIWPLYLEGDQQRYFIPCPYCGKFMLPDWGDEHRGWAANLNLKWETKAGTLDESTIHLPCPLCREAIFERDKAKMVVDGRWEPTARPMIRYRESFQASAVISLMDEWERIVLDEIKGEDDEDRRRAHVINNLGVTYKEKGARPDTRKILSNIGYYKRGQVPNDVLFLTMAVDVQLGVAKDPKNNPPRLEMEICGHGVGYRTWSIDYKVFTGPVDVSYEGAWAKLIEWESEGGLKFFRDDGFQFSPRIVFVDSRVEEGAVLDFCLQWANTFPIKGFRELKETERGKGLSAYVDAKHYKDIDKYREYKKGDFTYYLISTNLFKDALYRSLRVPRQQGEIQAPRFCDFPRDYPPRYFEMLTAEEKLKDGSYYKPNSRANEALDCRVYNMAAMEIWLASQLMVFRERARRSGMSREQADFIKTRHILEELKKATARRLTGRDTAKSH